jgi:hypothetical protein
MEHDARIVRNQHLLLSLSGDLRVSHRMHQDLDILKDPMFWGAMLVGILPIAMAGAVLVWFDF